jgi:L-threonylcarbamoyladenylate synthase
MVDQGQIERAAARIRAGGVVAFPTETVYGLGANALDPAAIRKIYEIKQRPATSPLIVHVSSIGMARELVSDWPATAAVLAGAFWPGPLTLVLPKAAKVPLEITAGLETVGIRMPSHPVALALIEAAGVPIAAPSANRFMQLSPTTAQHVADGLGDAVDIILDAGPTEVGIESTVLSLAGGQVVLLRPGMISQADIEARIGPIQVGTAAEGAHASPGLHDRHYSPRTPLYLIPVGTPLPQEGRGILLRLSPGPASYATRQMPPDPAQYASLLYDMLHQCDHEGWDWIAVEHPPADPAWAGITDRLLRASVR